MGATGTLNFYFCGLTTFWMRWVRSATHVPFRFLDSHSTNHTMAFHAALGVDMEDAAILTYFRQLLARGDPDSLGAFLRLLDERQFHVVKAWWDAEMARRGLQ